MRYKARVEREASISHTIPLCNPVLFARPTGRMVSLHDVSHLVADGKRYCLPSDQVWRHNRFLYTSDTAHITVRPPVHLSCPAQAYRSLKGPLSSPSWAAYGESPGNAAPLASGPLGQRHARSVTAAAPPEGRRLSAVCQRRHF